MAIDSSFPEETRHLLARVREFCERVVRPAEARIEACSRTGSGRGAAGDLPL